MRCRSSIITLKFNIFYGSIYGIYTVPNSIAWSLVKRYFMGRERSQWESLHQYCFFKDFFYLKLLWSKICRSAFLVAEVSSAFSIFRSHQSNLSSNIYQSHLARFKWLFCFVFFHAGTAHYSPRVWIWRRVNYLYFFEYVYTSDTHNVVSFPIRFLEGSYKFFSSILLVALTVMVSNKIKYSLHFGQLHANQFT